MGFIVLCAGLIVVLLAVGLLVWRPQGLRWFGASRQRSSLDVSVLASGLLAAREDERARLARDLHDELGAVLTTARLAVATLRQRAARGDASLLFGIAQLDAVLNDAQVAKRRIVEALCPSLLQSRGLRAALEDLAETFARQSGLAVDVEVCGVNVSEAAGLAVYRIVQAALSNVAEHARASDVTLSVWGEGGWLHVQVADNGVGFDPAQVASGGHGLFGMRQRVLALRGRLRIRAAPGAGCCLTVSVPLSAASDTTRRPAPTSSGAWRY